MIQHSHVFVFLKTMNKEYCLIYQACGTSPGDAIDGIVVRFIGKQNTRYSSFLFVTCKTREAVVVMTSVVSWSRCNPQAL